ncbi:unnamed protein product, partial [marine sediment metagenome]
MSEQDSTTQRTLEKIVFIATALSSTSISVAWWATNWFDFGPELAKYIGNRVVRWWRKRRQVADIKTLIEQIQDKLILDSEQVEMLMKLVDLVRENDDKLRKQIATEKSLEEICIDYLTEMKFNPRKIESAVESIIQGLREVLSVSVSLVDIYREQMVTRETSQTILNIQRSIITDIAEIGLGIPSSFTPLERKLEC